MAIDDLTVGPEHAGLRLDKVLAGLPGVGSRARARAALERGKVLVDGALVGSHDGGTMLYLGQNVVVDWNRAGTSPAHHRARAALVQADLKVLFEDDQVIAIEKPVGLLTDAADREQQLERDTVKKRLVQYLRPQGVHPIVCHRIDRDTTGVVLFAKDERSAIELKRQFRLHLPERVYRCVVQGTPQGESGEWVNPMRWDQRQLVQVPCQESDGGAVVGRANWRLIEALAQGCSHLEVRLYTGRRNQIRLQCAMRGMPMVGEALYVPAGHHARVPFPRQALHAHRLQVLHPTTGEPLTIESPLPADFRGLLRSLHARD